jgi:nudix-type nucleoside diphosphatase (YffH/AdpP family)
MRKGMTVEIIGIETVYSGWCKLLLASGRLPNGKTFRREIEDHGSAACVLPYHPQRKTAVLVRQFRAPVQYATGEMQTLEAIAGVVDEPDPSATACREAQEEAGLELGPLENCGMAWTMPGISTERMHLFLAEYRGSPRAEPGGVDDDESVTAHEIPLSELARLADAGGVLDMKTLLLVQTLRLRRRDLFAAE